jgi:hypothetical protein
LPGADLITIYFWGDRITGALGKKALAWAAPYINVLGKMQFFVIEKSPSCMRNACFFWYFTKTDAGIFSESVVFLHVVNAYF